MAYATPVTPSDFTNLINQLSWPLDCVDENAAAIKLKSVMEALRLGWENLRPIRLEVISDSSPTLGDWQKAWTNLGYSLPIADKTRGLWMMSDGSQSAEYIYCYNAMQPMLAYWWNGSSEFIESTPSVYTNTTTLSTTDTQLLNQTLTLDRAAYVDIYHAEARGTDITTTVQYRLSGDGAGYTRGVLWPNAASASPAIQTFSIRPDVKLSSGALQALFRTISGTGTVLFTNNAVTRKIETGAYPYFLGETSTLYTEAIYLT